MDNLVGVTAQEKLVRLAERFQNELELDHGQVLHLVDHDKIRARSHFSGQHLKREGCRS